METIRNFTVFISCPNDVSDEREAVEAAIRNYTIENKGSGISFEPFHYKMLPSSYGAPPQEKINQSLPDFDIYSHFE